MEGGGFFVVAGGNWGRLRASQQYRQPLTDPPTPESTDPKISAFFKVASTLIGIKYCEDTRKQNQLSAVQEQHI
jgi:hypothetical protein